MPNSPEYLEKLFYSNLSASYARRTMVDSALEAWVGKVVQLWAVGEDEPWLGVLEGWNERGVVLRYSQSMATFEASRGDRKLSPMMLLFPWSVVRFVGVELEELEGNQHSPDGS